MNISTVYGTERPYINFGVYLYVYTACIYGLNRIYMDRICRWCRFQYPATAVAFALFGQLFFPRLFLLSSSFATLFSRCKFFALINSCIGVYGSRTPFCTKKGIFLVFLARSRLSSLTIHFLGIKDGVMHTQLFKSCKMTAL
jgi:hypothetical protein